MGKLEDLREELRIAMAKKALEDHQTARNKEAKDIKKELFNLKHGKKIALIKHVGKNAKAMVNKAMIKSASKKTKKKKRYDPFGGVNFRAFG